MLRVFADDANDSFAKNDCAFVADFLNGRTDFHERVGLFLPKHDSSLRKVIGRELYEHRIPFDEIYEMLAHLPGNVGVNGVPAEFFWDFYFENSSWEGLYYDPLHFYLILFGHGMAWSNVQTVRKRKPAYCMEN